MDEGSGLLYVHTGRLAYKTNDGQNHQTNLTRYINANLDDFTWEGADVYSVDDSGKRARWGYSCRTTESALKKKDELLEKFQKVVVRDNATRKETVYARKCTD